MAEMVDLSQKLEKTAGGVKNHEDGLPQIVGPNLQTGVEIFLLQNRTLPDALKAKLTLPANIDTSIHPLAPFISLELLPSNLEIVILSDLNGFYHRLTQSPFAFMSTLGAYVSSSHTWMPKEDFEKVKGALQREFGIDIDRAILLPADRIDYWTMTHEWLHAAFDELPLQTKRKLTEVAANCFASLHDMLDLTHLDTSNFDWADYDVEVERKMEAARQAGRSPLDGLDEIYSFKNLKEADQFQCLDEYISNFYCNNRGKDRWNPKHLPIQMRKALEEVGYKLSTPPNAQ
jgi:hypothetical protein